MHTFHKCIVAATLAIVTYSVPLEAQSAGAADESALLAELAVASPEAAKRVDRELQRLWSQSGSAAMDLLLERGRDALKENDISGAIEHLTALTDHAPEFAEGWNVRASAYFHAELYGPAMADLERALALNPNNYDAILGVGAILELLGDHARAYRAYQKAQAIHPHHQDITTALDRLRSEIEGEAL